MIDLYRFFSICDLQLLSVLVIEEDHKQKHDSKWSHKLIPKIIVCSQWRHRKLPITAKVGMFWWRCPTTWVSKGHQTINPTSKKQSRTTVFSKDHCFEICVVCFVGLCFLLVSCLTKEAEMSLSACLQRSFNIQQRAIIMPTNMSCMIYESTVLLSPPANHLATLIGTSDQPLECLRIAGGAGTAWGWGATTWELQYDSIACGRGWGQHHWPSARIWILMWYFRRSRGDQLGVHSLYVRERYPWQKLKFPKFCINQL